MDYFNSHNGQHLHRGHRNRYQYCSRNHESFSSAVLAAVCKSTEDDEEKMGYKKSTRSGVDTRTCKAEDNRFTRTSRFERQYDEDPWLNNNEKYYMHWGTTKMGVFNTEKYEAEATYTQSRSQHHQLFQCNTQSATSYYSDYTRHISSIPCPYLSSDAESLYRNISSIPTANKTRRNSHHVASRGDRAVGGDCSRDLDAKSSVRDADFQYTEKPAFITADHHANINSKSKVLKNSKKPKQPASPAKKLASFFNSLFMAAGFTKKAKLSSTSSVSDFNSYDSSERKTASVCSSSSVQSIRSCLTKASRGSNNSGGRMSKKYVTFYPTSVIVNEDSRPCGVKSLQGMEKYPVSNANPSNYLRNITHPSADAYKFSRELKHIVEEERHATAAATAREIIAKYHKTNSTVEGMVSTGLEKPEEDDESSCSSSELFELENLDIKMELPVYETTHFMTNKAIAEGFIL